MTQSASVAISKVAKVTLLFWIMKILATTLGEIAGDYISITFVAGYFVGLAITLVLLAFVVLIQVTGNEFHPALFWTAIIATTTAGTEVSDFMDRSLGLGYAAGSLILVAGLLVTLTIWYARERNLRIYPIARKDVEVLFWTAVVFSNSLGTAFGDFLVSDVGLHYFQGAFVTAGIIGLVVALHFLTRNNEVLLFWIAFIFTRPFGATFGDFLTKPIADGGLDLPRGYASLITLVLLGVVLLVSATAARPNATTPAK